MMWFAPTPDPSPASGRGELVWEELEALAMPRNLIHESPLSRLAGEGPGVGHDRHAIHSQ